MAKEILIVEDDADIQDIYKQMIVDTFDGVAVKQCFNGKEGIAAVTEHRPDLILLDLLMPVMNGEEFLKELRSTLKIKDLPVIVCSVNQTLANQLLRKKHVAAVLPKIFPLKDFVKLLGKFLDIHPKEGAPGF